MTRTRVNGSGAAASGRGVAAGRKGIAAGRDVRIHNTYKITQVSARDYMRNKGPEAYRGMGDPDRPWTLSLEGEVEVGELRKMLLEDPAAVESLKHKSQLVAVKGFLYPCALLVSGWWESRMRKAEGRWQNGIQEWLFSGFHAWGPSWDFTWDFEHPEPEVAKRSFVAQLGNGDEANSIPVIIPADKVSRLGQKFQERGHLLGTGVSGVVAKVTGVLCHRSACPEAARLGLVGGILDFCIWLKPGEPRHRISPYKDQPEVYSGYLWKCLAPREWMREGKPLNLNQVYFVWEHTNWIDESAIKYNLDSLERKEAYIRQEIHGGGELVLLQKSSLLVPGAPQWTKQEFYDFFENKENDI